MWKATIKLLTGEVTEFYSSTKPYFILWANSDWLTIHGEYDVYGGPYSTVANFHIIAQGTIVA